MSKLIIKAANGSVDDFPVEAPLEWTILELKRHLFKNYPSKPEVLFQKLVCGGKLLQDGTKITEVVSSASGGAAAVPSEDPLVVHLVVYDRSMSAPAVSPSTSRTAQSSRDLNSNSSSRTSQNGGAREQGSASTVSPPNSGNESLPDDHGLRFRMGMPPNGPNVQNIPMPGGGAYPYPMAPPPQFYMSPYGQMYANQFQQWYNAYYRPREAVGEADEGGGGGEPNQLDLPGNGNARNEAPDGGEDAEEVNAPGGVGMMAGGAGVGGIRQRDMVDYLYMFMMISFLVFVAYVTNSLGRLLIFTGGVIFMLLNQGGFFALQRRRVAVRDEDLAAPGPQQHERGHDDQPHPQDQQEHVDQAHADEGGDQNIQDRGEDDVADSDNSSSQSGTLQAQDPSGNSSPNAQNAPQGPGVLATIYIFITTFFTSLVPQQRPELQLN